MVQKTLLWGCREGVFSGLPGIIVKMFFIWLCCVFSGLPRWLSGKESACQCRRCRTHRSNPWVRKIPWRRKWEPTPVFLPGKFHRQKSLAACSPWDCKEWTRRSDLVHTCVFRCLSEGAPGVALCGDHITFYTLGEVTTWSANLDCPSTSGRNFSLLGRNLERRQQKANIRSRGILQGKAEQHCYLVLAVVNLLPQGSLSEKLKT